jgi:chitin synthase
MCVLLICTQFILSMGNRPQGFVFFSPSMSVFTNSPTSAKRMFMWSMILLFIIMAYNTFCALYVVISSLAGTTKVTEYTKIAIGDNLFTNLVVSTASTIGVYLVMSILYFDPWHMFTSALQYFMMLPSYICTLQVYAFCNTHDVSWGTKGDNTTHTDLGAAVGSKDDTVELEMPSEQLDIDSGYDEALRNLRDRLEVAVEPVSEAQLNEDYYRAFRTYMVVIWLIANAVLVMAITEIYQIDEVGTNFYLKFLLWAVAAISIFRAIGSSSYLVIEVIHMIIEGKIRVDTDWTDRFQPEWRRVLKKKTRGG